MRSIINVCWHLSYQCVIARELITAPYRNLLWGIPFHRGWDEYRPVQWTNENPDSSSPWWEGLWKVQDSWSSFWTLNHYHSFPFPSVCLRGWDEKAALCKRFTWFSLGNLSLVLTAWNELNLVSAHPTISFSSFSEHWIQ